MYVMNTLFSHTLIHLPLDKMAAILAEDFSNAFSSIKMIKLQLQFHWNLFPTVQLTINQHCSVEGLVLNRRQAITWTNGDPVHWCIYAALRGDELTQWCHMVTYIWVNMDSSNVFLSTHYPKQCWIINISIYKISLKTVIVELLPNLWRAITVSCVQLYNLMYHNWI